MYLRDLAEDSSSKVPGTSRAANAESILSSSQLSDGMQITHNRSLEGITEFLNSRHMTEAGPGQLIEDASSGSDVDDRLDHINTLPGATRGDKSSRRAKAVARTKCVRFAPTGRQVCEMSFHEFPLIHLANNSA